ncbi:phosphate acyltransferase PlsX [Oscillospiraceae bacterium LCP25S3_E10]|nr:phosphate acyltransferase PlsX [Ruminococcus sp.]MDD6447473.1 phosphate acyltransferase PlsX [Ruminococcus sp.]MDY2856408.1 phosphate acyltransferase PlsX [Oscillospiraceae bacterium]
MKIIVDAFGGDNAPLEIIKGCALAVEDLGIDIILTGDKNIIKKTAIENGISLNNIKVVHTDVVISPDDDASAVVKEKKNSSMGMGFQLLNSGEGDAFVSAGNSGALVMGSSLIIKRIKGVKRPAFAPVMPKAQGCFMLVDGGANNEVRPDMLQQFAIMGSIYMNKVMGIDNPRVGLANVGTEEHKGGSLQQEAYELLKATPINFIGNVEGRDIPADGCDVLVTDGFNGNLILKTYEGVAMELMGKIKGLFKKNAKNKIAATMIMSDLKKLAKEMDYNEYGGAAIMGVNKPVFKAHGSSKAKTIKSALRLTKQFVEGNVVEEISTNIAKL